MYVGLNDARAAAFTRTRAEASPPAEVWTDGRLAVAPAPSALARHSACSRLLVDRACRPVSQISNCCTRHSMQTWSGVSGVGWASKWQTGIARRGEFIRSSTCSSSLAA